jgi:hypothetical protein
MIPPFPAGGPRQGISFSRKCVQYIMHIIIMNEEARRRRSNKEHDGLAGWCATCLLVRGDHDISQMLIDLTIIINHNIQSHQGESSNYCHTCSST